MILFNHALYLIIGVVAGSFTVGADVAAIPSVIAIILLNTTAITDTD